MPVKEVVASIAESCVVAATTAVTYFKLCWFGIWVITHSLKPNIDDADCLSLEIDWEKALEKLNKLQFEM